MSQQAAITKESVISIGLVVSIVGAAIWLTVYDARSQARIGRAEEKIVMIESKQDRVGDKLDLILEKVIRLEEQRGRKQ